MDVFIILVMSFVGCTSCGYNIAGVDHCKYFNTGDNRFFVNIIDGGKPAPTNGSIFSHYTDCEHFDISVRFKITKLKHTLTTLLVEYSTIGMYVVMFQLIKCIIAATILSWRDAVNVHVKSLGMQFFSDYSIWGLDHKTRIKVYKWHWKVWTRVLSTEIMVLCHLPATPRALLPLKYAARCNTMLIYAPEVLA